MKLFNSIITASLLISSAMALEPMQKESGFSGYVVLGGGYLSYANNEVAGNAFARVDDGQTIYDRGSASTQSTGVPVITGVARYTLEGEKTELFVGNSLEDYLRLDATLALGVRHNFGEVGIIGARILLSSSPTEVWQDPLATNYPRTRTDRNSAGLGLKWESIFGSNFEVDFRARNIKLDNDVNGISLVNNSNVGGIAGINGEHYISGLQRSSLDREGSLASIEFLYTWTVNQNNYLIPSIRLTNNDSDGDARDYKQGELQLTYLFVNADWLIASTINVGSADYNNDNPVYWKDQDTTTVSGGINATYKNLFGSKNWGLNTGFYAAHGDSNIDFYDTKMFIATVGVAYNF